jgi:20S proteasome alpha/beta subunit
MTSVIGILCVDGVVIGTDSSATFDNSGRPTIEQPIKKVSVISQSVIVAGTGQVGLGQRFSEVVRKGWEEERAFTGSPIEVSKMLTRKAIDDFQSTKLAKINYGALVAFPLEHKPFLCEFAIGDFQPELKNTSLWYCSMGSAQPITDPFLGFLREVFWEDTIPNINEGVFSVLWTLDHAIKLNPGGVNGPPQIAVLEKIDTKNHQARELTEEDLFEHREHINEVKEILKDFKDNFSNPKDVPEAPKL